MFLFVIFGVQTNAQQVAINEVMTSNSKTIADEDGSFEDWIEIYNYGTTAVNLGGYGLTDDASNLYKWVFPTYTLQPKQFVLVWASDKNKTVPSQPLHTNFKIKSSGEPILLTNSSGTTINDVPAIALQADVSYARSPDGTGDWLFFTTATPLALNTNAGTPELLEPPIFSHESGLYTSTFNLSLSTTVQNAQIIYTLDGSEPRLDNLSGTNFTYKNLYPLLPGDPYGDLLTDSYKSNVYSSAIVIRDKSGDADKLAIKNTNQYALHIPPNPVRKATVIKAKIFVNGKGSESISKTFFVWSGGNPFNIPLVSLQIQENLLFDYNDGIYTSGVDFDTWRQQNPDNTQSWRPNISNYARSGRDWEYPVNVELFDAVNLNSIQSINAGLRIHGNNSRGLPIKNLRLYARSEYDSKNEFVHGFFDNSIPNAANLYNKEYKKFFLRGDGEGGSIAYDVAFSRAMQPVFNGVTRIKPVINFINGEYWGINAVRDRLDDDHYELNFGVNADNFIQVSCNGSQCELDEGVAGDYSSYIDMRDFIINNDMANNLKYLEAAEILDMESFLNHAVMIIYASNNSYERKYWRARTPQNNSHADGKWRLNVQDFEASLSTNTNWLEYLADLGRSDNNSLLANLLKNEGFKNQFLNRFADIMNTVFTKENFDKVINKTFDEISPFLTEDRNRSSRANFYESSEKQNLLDWSKNRPAVQIQLIKNQFNISETIDVGLSVSDIEAGFIKINTIKIHSDTPGVNENPYPWSGFYFKTIPLTVEAVTLPGYVFSHWSGDISGTNAIQTFTPNGSVQIQANYNPITNFKHLMYFWLMNADIPNDAPLQSVNATFSRTSSSAVINYKSSLTGYPFNNANASWRKASLERKNEPTALNYFSNGNHNIAYDPFIMRGVQIKQPFKNGNNENTLELNFPTSGFRDVKLSFAIFSNGAAQTVLVDYWNGSSWSNANLTNPNLSISDAYAIKEFDFSNVTIADNNANFKVRIRFNGTNMTIEDNKQVFINNIAVEGVDTTLSSDSFTQLQNLKVYPNPTSGDVKIQSNQIIDKVLIYNVFGKLVYKDSPKFSNIQLSMENLSSGVYVLKVFSNNATITKKIIKK
ncbi:hypothetical protein BTO16_10320 [Polaribacter glomeratus]|uniref:LTD domain-containing protein n=2 Tax=Polaribacter glomeratus TaxID=102 RepID=A0A2S7WFD0_9FLAO|nr:hypothetical protein BTO16_10320 [Polaribacter glomeratus]